ncbi:MAG: hypothetical protein ACYCPO_11980 [Acidobacteriaceae bacterium]
MEIVIKISDQLAAQAQALGVRPETYVEEILSRQEETNPSKSQPRRTPNEIRAWLDSLAQFSDKIPSLPETLSREWIYQDHD